MQEVYKSQYQEISWEETSKILHVSWLDTEFMDDDVYRQDVLEQVLKIEQFLPKSLLIDMRTFNFPITPETQEWSAKEVFSRTKEAGVKKVAIIVPNDIFAKVSLEQNIEEDRKELLTFMYFEMPLKAKAWLLK